MSQPTQLSDKALSVFAFAAYHQLSTAQAVVKVAAVDGAGHAADPEAVQQLQEAGLATLDGDQIAFTEAGLKRLERIVSGIGS